VDEIVRSTWLVSTIFTVAVVVIHPRDGNDFRTVTATKFRGLIKTSLFNTPNNQQKKYFFIEIEIFKIQGKNNM
jgi:hypothetical protein